MTFEESPDPESIEWVTVDVPGDKPDPQPEPEPVEPEPEPEPEAWKPRTGDRVKATGSGVVSEVDDQSVVVRFDHGAVEKDG